MEEYKINENEIKIYCSLTEHNKELEYCKNCQINKNCRDIEKSIIQDFENKRQNKFKEFVYNQKCPEPKCQNCLYSGEEQIQNCDFFFQDKDLKKIYEEKFINSQDNYYLNEKYLEEAIKTIKGEK